ncbi:MAG: UvrD-helicase domain-containing protein [Tessaracoccus sp.]
MSDSLFPDLFAVFAPAPDDAPPSRSADADEAPARPVKAKRISEEELLEGLNPPQRQAVLHSGSPVLVVAGAGSGKTRVLTRRIAHLVSQRDVHPGSILAITFTNKAAAEMRERVVELVGNRAKLMWVSTFHSACVRILRSDIDRFGINKSFSIYDDADSKRLMSLVLRDQEVDPKKYPVRAVMNAVGNYKNELVDFETAVAEAQTPNQKVYAEAYRDYQARLSAANALDFDDLIMTTVNLFQAFPDVREKYRRRFRHVLVDEYQDTNTAQYVLIRELCGDVSAELPPGTPVVEPAELMVVGDSDQSIYAFRGATIRNILDFEQDFPGATTVVLDQNYRSTQHVLTAANAVISRNQGRREKRLWSDLGEGDLIVGWVADTEQDEAHFIATEIDELMDKGVSTYGDTAVFYRTNAQSRAIEEVFIRVGMPYKVVGGVRFYERREIRDAIAYLRALANPASSTSCAALSRLVASPARCVYSGNSHTTSLSRNQPPVQITGVHRIPPPLQPVVRHAPRGQPRALPPVRLQLVLMHELADLRRRDPNTDRHLTQLPISHQPTHNQLDKEGGNPFFRSLRCEAGSAREPRRALNGTSGRVCAHACIPPSRLAQRSHLRDLTTEIYPLTFASGTGQEVSSAHSPPAVADADGEAGFEVARV